MTWTAKGPAAVGAASRAGHHRNAPAEIVAHPTRPSLGSLSWRRARGLLTISDYTRPDVAGRPMLAYPEQAATTSAARFGDRKQRRDTRQSSAFFHACKFMAGRAGSPSGLPVPLPGSPTRHGPPPFWRGVAVSKLQRRPTMPNHTTSAPAPTATSLFEAAFHPHREPRSEAYRAGVLAALRYRLGEAEHVECPYRPGTAESDAFFSGVDEGHQRAREALDGPTSDQPTPDLDTIRLHLDGHRRLIVQGTNRLTALAFSIHEQADERPLLQELAQILADEASHLAESVMDDFEALTERLGLGRDGGEGEQ